MGNAIRWLKQEISHISIDTSEQQAKDILCARIDDFIKEKIDLSDQLIVENASQHIVDGSTILTFGHSQVLEELFKYCVIHQDKKFNLIIVDSRPLFEGKKLLNNLINTDYTSSKQDHDSEVESITSARSTEPHPITTNNLKMTYVLISSLTSTVLEDVDCVFLGAHAMLSNGRLYSRVGTALIAMMAHTRNIPVLTCCESVKFSDKVQLDSVTTNELADPDDLVQDIHSKNPPHKKSSALEQFIKQFEDENKPPEKPKSKQQSKKDKEAEEVPENPKAPLQNWKKIDKLNILNIMYDLTPPEYIKKVITELGALPPSSVPVILREYKNT
jgi:translation initiation factor eIF-2B subunit delta